MSERPLHFDHGEPSCAECFVRDVLRQVEGFSEDLWPGAPDWMDAWDGEEPFATFCFRVGPREKVETPYALFEDESSSYAKVGEMPDGDDIVIDPTQPDLIWIVNPDSIAIVKTP